MMRLNRVKSFYMFLLRFRSESSKERGRLDMARPSARAADHGQPPCRGDRLRPRLRGQPLAKGGCPWRACKGRPPADNGQHARDYRQLGRRCWPQGWPPLGRVAASRKGPPLPSQGGDDGVVKAKRARASFLKKMIISLRI
ncbi:hypothetical protein GW17_00058728 [Ensete ventricosum]|nr:hypothetical protein GW17_00058728 [Ensete ventricosum]